MARHIHTGTPLVLPDGSTVEVLVNTYPDEPGDPIMEVAVRDPATGAWLPPARLTHTETDRG